MSASLRCWQICGISLRHRARAVPRHRAPACFFTSSWRARVQCRRQAQCSPLLTSPGLASVQGWQAFAPHARRAAGDPRARRASAADARKNTSGKVSHSACQPPSPRSCSLHHRSQSVETSPGIRAAAASTMAEATGLRLCGMVEEPPRPSVHGSDTSATSVSIRRETSRAILPSVPATDPNRCYLDQIVPVRVPGQIGFCQSERSRQMGRNRSPFSRAPQACPRPLQIAERGRVRWLPATARDGGGWRPAIRQSSVQRDRRALLQPCAPGHHRMSVFFDALKQLPVQSFEIFRISASASRI